MYPCIHFVFRQFEHLYLKIKSSVVVDETLIYPTIRLGNHLRFQIETVQV